MFGIKLIRENEWTKLKEEMTLYQRQLEDLGWINLSLPGDNSQELIFSQGFQKMLQQVKIYYYKNPLAGLWVNLTTQFVFGEGISSPKCEDEKIQEIVDTFWEDTDNKKALTSFAAQQALSNKLQVEGNLFFVLFTDVAGNVKVRILNTEEVEDVICDPEDRIRPDFYKVKKQERIFNFVSGAYTMQIKPSVYFASTENFDPASYGIPPERLMEARIMHFKINCDINDKFGVPELYRGVDWMRAQKDMSEDLATLVKALSQFAWKKKVKGSAAQTASIAGALQSKMNLQNIKNSAGQMQVENEGVDLQSIDVKTGGIRIGVDGARQMKLMVCAASGIYEHYYGDPSTGNLATAKTMELPMVKKFVTYQSLWTDIYLAILNYQIDQKIAVGELSGNEEIDIKNKRVKYITNLDRQMDLDFPPILEEDLWTWAQALEKAKTAGLVGEELAAQLFMLAANVNNIDEELEKVMAENEEREKKQEEMFGTNGFGDFPQNGNKNGNGKPTSRFKEAIELSDKRVDVRRLRKENYMLQKLNGYRKEIAGHYRQLLRDVRESVRVSTLNNQYVGQVQGFYSHLNKFIDGMQEAAKLYYPIAIQIGEKFMQANLKDLFPNMHLNETIYEAKGRAKGILEKRLFWNDAHLTNSLEPAIIKAYEAAIRQPYTSEREFRTAVNKALNKFEGRLELYAGAFWTVEEEAVKEAGRGTGAQVNFVGPEDTANCPGCENALAGNPWPIDQAPLPGEQDCLGRCRHALQLITEGTSEPTTESLRESLYNDEFSSVAKFGDMETDYLNKTFKIIEEEAHAL